MRQLVHGSRIDIYEVDLALQTQGQLSGIRELVAHPGAVVILPLLDDQVVMIRNHRWAINRELWELPAGTLEPPEPPDLCAGRELVEETGYRAGRIVPLINFYSSPGFCSELLHTFVATDLEHVGQHLEETEKIQVELLPFTSVLEMVKSNQICDAKTIATLLYYDGFLRAK